MPLVPTWLSFRLLLALHVAALAGWILHRLHAPLPWMIGPLLSLAIANGLHARIAMPQSGRAIGQWLVGTALGLYFTAPVLAHITTMGGWIALAVLLSMLMSVLSGQVLSRLGGADAGTAFFASSVGGAAEMAYQAERHGARVDQVAAAQAIRVLMVVIIVPFVFKFSGVHGSDAYMPTSIALHWPGLAGLLAASALSGALFWRLGVPNGWLFGPLALSTLLSVTGHPLSAVPPWLVNIGQLLIGCSLGARFAPEFFRDSPRYMFGVIVSGVVLLGGCAAIGLLVGVLSGISLPTAVLATAPGGLAEMGLTAKALQLGVPIVTAFHTVRLTAVVLSAGPAYRLLVHWSSRRRD
jgi:membrane AbrB-like protein